VNLVRPRFAPKIVIGIDPGTGSKSNTGLAILNMEDMEIILSCELSPMSKYGTPDERIYDISSEYSDVLSMIVDGGVKDEDIMVVFEHFVMKGKSGETMNRLIGGLIGRTKYQTYHINNLVVKKKMTGFGGSDDKKAVGRGLESVFRDNHTAVKIIKDLIDAEKWDRLDAIAIGVSGYEEFCDNYKKAKKPTKPKKGKQRKGRQVKNG